MGIHTPADTLHRLVKQLLDSGVAESLEEAETIFNSYSLSILIRGKDAIDPNKQAALLTTIALGRRVFLGGVHVDGELDEPLLVPFALGTTLRDAVIALGGCVGQGATDAPLVIIGGEKTPKDERFSVRTVFSGWRGGIVPSHSDFELDERPVMALSPMLAAALAINEAFLYVSKDSAVAGLRPVGLSLWNPSQVERWMEEGGEPELQFLPSSLWLIGLGHLGQAYLWAIGLLPYSDPTTLQLVLQDTDVITPSTVSTSILSDEGIIGQKKTRAMAAWAETRGFKTSIIERLFDDRFKRRKEEPGIALCGVDNKMARRALEQVGFDLVIEAGLGNGYQDFRSLRLHTLPGLRKAQQIWKHNGQEKPNVNRPAYKKLLDSNVLDQCGITLLAGKAIGAPFVGAVAACLAISEVLRFLHGGSMNELIDVNLLSVENRTVVSQKKNFEEFNFGFIRIDEE